MSSAGRNCMVSRSTTLSTGHTAANLLIMAFNSRCGMRASITCCKQADGEARGLKPRRTQRFFHGPDENLKAMTRNSVDRSVSTVSLSVTGTPAKFSTCSTQAPQRDIKSCRDQHSRRLKAVVRKVRTLSREPTCSVESSLARGGKAASPGRVSPYLKNTPSSFFERSLATCSPWLRNKCSGPEVFLCLKNLLGIISITER
mmetsp:Transcript_12682/g.19108  ORF Transcript_12682/g.19108 Transcript_12682/m.19108 type:complete len:201 (-) Transcript_12682:482-1084(-)